MLEEENIKKFIDQAIDEEEKCNWAEAVKIYREIGEFFISKKLNRKAADIYKKLGFCNSHAAETVDSKEKFFELKESASKAYDKAHTLYKKSGEEAEELECKAESLIEKEV